MAHPIKMPDLNTIKRVGKIVEWKIKEGEEVRQGDIVVIVEGRKTTYEVEAPAAGILNIMRPEGSEVDFGAIIATIAGDKAEYAEIADNAEAIQPEHEKTAIKIDHDDSPMEVHIVVIGGGPGGYPAAIRAAQMGARVTIVENRGLGGTCINRGCIPTKALLHTANILHEAAGSADYGVITDDPKLDFSKAMQRKDDVVKNLVEGLEYVVKSNRISVVKGTGCFLDPKTIRVVETGQTIEADKAIIATGSAPFRVPIKGRDLPGVITSDDALFLKDLPKSIVIIGGGVIGIEFAQIFNRMGVDVTVVEMLPHILPYEDEALSGMLEGLLKEEGINFFTKTQVEEIMEHNGKKRVRFGQSEKEADLVLNAVGRTPYTEGLGADGIGLKMKKGTILVNEYLETNVSGVYAVGDVIGNYMLAHVATSEGEHAAQNALGNQTAMDYSAVPRCVYSSPELASVGLTEKEAKEKYGKVKIGKFPFDSSGKALILGDMGGMVKIIAEPNGKKIVGVHMLGPHATDLIAEATLGIQMSASIDDLAHTIHPHPTLSEAIMEAALDTDGFAIHLPSKRWS